VVEFLGGQQLEKIKVKNNQTNKIEEMDFDGAFVAIGHTPSTKIFENQLKLDEKGYILVQDHTQTNVKGVFVAGDVHDYTYKQAITAAGFGCMAALEVLKYLDKISP
jgi:thioredoxin reductase (NADPH)